MDDKALFFFEDTENIAYKNFLIRFFQFQNIREGGEYDFEGLKLWFGKELGNNHERGVDSYDWLSEFDNLPENWQEKLYEKAFIKKEFAYDTSPYDLKNIMEILPDLANWLIKEKQNRHNHLVILSHECNVVQEASTIEELLVKLYQKISKFVWTNTFLPSQQAFKQDYYGKRIYEFVLESEDIDLEKYKDYQFVVGWSCSAPIHDLVYIVLGKDCMCEPLYE